VSWGGIGCCGPSGPMSGLGLAPGIVAGAMGPTIARAAAPLVAEASLAADVEALEAERAALQAQLDAVRGRRAGGGDGWPWWAKVGGGILAVAATVKLAQAIARRGS
jgi:hypothetical protein